MSWHTLPCRGLEINVRLDSAVGVMVGFGGYYPGFLINRGQVFNFRVGLRWWDRRQSQFPLLQGENKVGCRHGGVTKICGGRRIP